MIKFTSFSSEINDSIKSLSEGVFDENFIKEFHRLPSYEEKLDFLIKLVMVLIRDITIASKRIEKFEKALKNISN